MMERKSWEEFRNSGMLWWINMILHTFGWTIAMDVEDDGSVSKVYPARVKFRGFTEQINSDGYIKVSNYLKDNADDLVEESEE